MNEPNLAIFSLRPLLAASKRKSYREGWISYCQVLVCFLQRHGLTRRQLLKPDEIPDEKFTLMQSDLTDEGFDFIKQWEGHLELTQPIDNASTLEVELERVRSRYSD